MPKLTIEPPVEPPAYTCPRCPVCDAETDKLLRDRWGNIVGCPECVKEVDAWTLQVTPTFAAASRKAAIAAVVRTIRCSPAAATARANPAHGCACTYWTPAIGGDACPAPAAISTLHSRSGARASSAAPPCGRSTAIAAQGNGGQNHDD